MRKFIILIFILNASSVFSQKTDTKEFNLEWNDYTPVKLRSKRTIIIPLVKNSMLDDQNIPVYSTSFNVQKNTKLYNYSIKNVKYAVLTSDVAINLQKNKIPVNLNSDFNIRNSREKTRAILRMTPLIRIGKQIKKVISFTLEYQTGTEQNKNTENQNTLRKYASGSVLASGSWYKFAVDTTGVFKIDKAFLQKLGLNTSNLNPANIRIYGNGGNLLPQLNSAFRYDGLQENAIYIKGGEDGSFDNNDLILFYAKGPESWELNTADVSRSKHINNIYSDRSYYFLTVDLGPGKRITSAEPIDRPEDININTFHEFLVHERDEKNLFANGQQWLGEDFSFDESQSFTFDFSNLNPSKEVFIRVRGVAVSSTSSNMQISVNGQNLMQISYSAISSNSLNLASPGINVQGILLNSDQINIGINYNNNANPSAKAYLDYIEVIGSKDLVAGDHQFSFRNIETTNPDFFYNYTITNPGNIFQVWDVSDPVNIKQIPNESSQNNFSFRSFGSTKPREFVVINELDLYEPETIENSKIENQDLHGLKDIDYLIITRDYLMPDAQKLADYHQQNSGLATKVVDLEKIYNEFGSGSPDLTAIRDFVRFLYVNASSDKNKIKYVCLFGDASYDFKDRITDNNNIVPAFQSYESFNLARGYVTDDYFGMMDEDEGEMSFSDQQDVATGRFIVNTNLEAQAAVNKTLNYYRPDSFGDWRNIITVVADDPDTPGEFILQKAVDAIAEDIKANKPEFNIKKIYCDAYTQETSAGGERYPEVNIAIDNAMESGTLVIDYFGHGGVDGWANERILEVQQVQNWKNFNTLPLFITVTCEYSRFDNPVRKSAGEYTLLNTQGGATSMISTTREIYISVGQNFNKKLIQYLLEFNNEHFTISEALMETKSHFTSAQRFFVYNFGDPAMKLAQSKPNVSVTKMNGEDINVKTDTLKALSHIKFDGIVTDQTGQILSNFNGEVSAVIFDKAVQKSTLDNNGFGKVMDFTSIESKIYRGRASVTGGRFSFEFIVPKDIRIAFGKSKLSFYADDKQTDRGGYDTDIIIGGINSNAPEDNTGPEIKLFLNDESFVDGGNTNTSPLLLAVLEDESGINTSITAVDHDIIAVIDNDEANPIILNDYYQTELDNFKSGKVKYQIRNLEPGSHTIKFKCWDTYNNLSESSLNFIVVDNNNIVLSNVLNYPNPFVNYTEFWFNHNKPNETLEVQIQIFTISGKLIKTINQVIQTTGSLSRDITWDGLDDFGNKIGKGVYIYKLKVRSAFSDQRAEKIEKLVILQ